MTKDERQEMNRLCTAVQQEKDPAKFSQALQDLTAFLDGVEQRKLALSKPAAKG
jgi:cytochrome c1